MFDEIYQESFIVDTDTKAEWALKKIAEIEQEYNRLTLVCEEQLTFYEQMKIEYKQHRDKERNKFVGMLAQYFENVPSKPTKTQATYNLPSGRLIKKLEKQELKHDPEKLLVFLKGTDFVELKPILKWGEYKKTLQNINGKIIDENGEIVEGVTVEMKPASFDVEVG